MNRPTHSPVECGTRAFSQVILFSALTLLAGCGEKPPPPTRANVSTPAPPPPGKNTMQTIVGGLTGSTAVEIGKESKSRIEAAAKREKDSLAEVMQ